MAETLDIVADVGGTNTRVALATRGKVVAGSTAKFRNDEYSGLQAVLETYVSDAQQRVDGRGCVAIAGPVRADNTGRLTNRDWPVDGAALAEALGLSRMRVINDLQAHGAAVVTLPSSALETLKTGLAAPTNASCLVVNVGTGFNIAIVDLRSGAPHVPPSEAGHASLPVKTDEDLRLARYLGDLAGFASIEEALSGRGLPQIYGFHAGLEPDALPSSQDVIAWFDQGADHAAQQTIETSVRLLGAVTGDMALISVPFGGVFLIGGMANALLDRADRSHYIEAFQDKGRFSSYLDPIAVHRVLEDSAALDGCAATLGPAG